jgi:DNA repair exonuclease SbcCD nuclease subunit
VKIVVTSDWHGDWVTHGVRRFLEIEEAVHETVDRAVEENADAYVFLGDLCNPDSGSSVFRVIRLAMEAAIRLREREIASIWISGNHDVIEDGSGETTLTPLRALVDASKKTPVCVFESPGEAVLFGRRGGPATKFFALPYTPTNRQYSPPDVAAQHARDAVVLSHLTEISGVAPGEEFLEMPRGRGIRLPLEQLGSAKMILQGHFHRQQKVGPVWIPGSLARLTFCEETHSPGYLVLEV